MTSEPPTVFASELLPGTYCCVSTTGLFGRVIRMVTRSRYDHALIYLGSGDIVEATVTGVRISRLASYSGRPMCANAAEAMTDTQRAGVCAKGRSFAGDEYGWGTIALIALRLAGIRSRWLTRLLSDRDAVICSQLVCEAGEAEGLTSWQCGEPSPQFVEPAELARRPGMERVIWDTA